MHRLLEQLLGIDPGFLSRQGELSLRFAPRWPLGDYISAGIWTAALSVAAIALVVYVYRREGRSRAARISLAIMRCLLLGLIILLLNRPLLVLTQSRVEPSVLAVLVDDSLSMKVPDVATGTAGQEGSPQTRLAAAVGLLDGDDQALLRKLAAEHTIHIYRMDRDAQPLGAVAQLASNASPVAAAASATAADAARVPESPEQMAQTLNQLKPQGQSTQILAAVRTVLDDLQGQRLAGIVLLTDGREAPAQPMASALDAIRSYGVRVYPVAVGTARPPQNVAIQTLNLQDSAFKGDIVNTKITLTATGYSPGHEVALVLKDQKTGLPLPGIDGKPAQTTVHIDGGDQPQVVELPFKPDRVGTLDVVADAQVQPGELDDQDNVRTEQISVLDSKVAVLFVDGYPRWDYRYLKDELIRDKSFDVSCLLTSADPGFSQQGTRPIRRFPESIQELLTYDVVLLGDVDPRQFADAQLQLISQFVAQKGGGFAMVAGPRFAPQAYRNTPIESILPVTISSADQGPPLPQTITQGFRPILTRLGQESSIFRFFADKAENDRYLREDWQPVFWYCRGVAAKPGVGEVYAEHPDDLGPDGHKAPILVLGRFGAGRTAFCAIDDSWRWRFYTGEHVFDTYWVQLLRYLARSRKLGQRQLTFTASRANYELGQQIQVTLHVLDPQLLLQLPDQLRVDVQDEQGEVRSQQPLIRQEGQPDTYVASWTADRVGRFSVQLPPVAGGVDALRAPIQVITPRLELDHPQVDRALLARLASDTLGQTVPYADAAAQLPALLPSAARRIPVQAQQPLWDAPLALVLFVLLITTEWILRKMYGMV